MILITGHLGFIGSRLIKHFPDAIGLDVRSGMNLLTCDLPKDIDVIYHLAAQSDVESSWHDPLHDLDNIRITARLVKEYPHAKIIYANSCAAIDRSSPYGFSKGVAGEYIHGFHENWVDCVFPNIYGEGSRSVVDKFKRQDEVTIFGDGTHTRDYVHIDDIIDGLIKAKEWAKGTYYMGSGYSTNVLTLAGDRAIIHAPARKEASDVAVPNTTPNWNSTIKVLEYINERN